MQTLVLKGIGCFIALLTLCPAGRGAAAQPTFKLWVEAESYAEQKGASAHHYDMANASGGKIVNSNWGADTDHYLRYEIEIPKGVPQLYVTLKYARKSAGNADVEVAVDDKQKVRLALSSTGGWGFDNGSWAFARAVLPNVAVGEHTLWIRSRVRRGNVNTDGFFVSDKPLPSIDLPRERPQTALASAEDRARLLGPHLDKIRRVVFTKHFDMDGSHYAYTDAVSDEDTLNPNGRVKEFNYRGGSSLCLLEIGDDFTVKETLLLHEKDGVFRDPDVSYDGKRILFSPAHFRQGHLLITRESIFPTATSCSVPRGASKRRLLARERVQHVLDEQRRKYMRRVGVRPGAYQLSPGSPGSGLVTYTRWEYNDRGQIYPQPLFRMYPNGAQQTEYYGNNSYFPTTILHARGIPGTGKVWPSFPGTTPPAREAGHHRPFQGTAGNQRRDPCRSGQETSRHHKDRQVRAGRGPMAISLSAG